MTAFDPEKITFFAKTDARGQEVAFGIKARDRQRHMYVVGKTGMGKSTMLENMAAQDIQNGEGMAFIDPHGSAAETLLEYVPEHRVNDVVYFAPFDLNHPVSFNVMEDVGPDKRHLVVSGLMSTFKKIWVDAWSARMEYILTNALLALIEYPDTTLLSVNRLFVDKEYRKKVVDYIQDPAVKAFWVDEFANYTDRFTAEALPAIQNKIGQFTGNPLIRNIIGQPHSSFDIRKLMDEKKILIMNLSKGLIGETNANLLGSMLTTRIYLAAMSRADLHVEEMKKMPNFYFYVDEFQSFANATFANILSEARKYHLNLIIAHQYIEQMEEDVRNAVFGNVGTTIAFRVGPFDAEVLETVFAPRFEATDLVNLGFAQIYLTLMIDGIGSQPFSAKTLPPVQLPEVSYREMVIDSSRQHYAHNREEVEAIVAKLHTPERSESPKKSFDKRSNNNGQGNGKPNGFRKNDNGNDNGNGNGNGNGNWNGNRNGAQPNHSQPNAPAPTPRLNRSETAERPRPPQTQKTPDDLRQILSKMTEENQGETKQKPVSNSVSVTTEKEVQKPAQKPLPQSGQKGNQTESEARKKTASERPAPSARRPDQKENRPTPKSARAAETPDLKSALADVLKKITPPPESQSAAQPSQNKPPQSVDGAAVPKTETASAQPPSDREEIKTSPAQTPADTQPISPQQPVRRVSVEPRRQPVTSESASLSPEADSTPIASSQLDSTKIKRMLNQSENERSPFN